MTLQLKGKTALITGASRGIGAATAIKLAELGADIVLNYRSKAARAVDVAEKLRAVGAHVLPVQADITSEAETAAMFGQIARLDFLILNASGGMEKDRAEDYALLLNRDAQMRLAQSAAPLMPRGSRIVFVTSHWAHFYGSKPVMPDYEAVAQSKHAGEAALRSYAAELAEKGISLVVVSGDLIEGTITPRLLQRQMPGLIESRRQEAGSLPTVDDFAAAIVDAAVDATLTSGHTVYVGAI